MLYNGVFFFFQAEDGIRDLYVTGVQTCALPISSRRWNPTMSASGPSAGGSCEPSAEFRPATLDDGLTIAAALPCGRLRQVLGLCKIVRSQIVWGQTKWAARPRSEERRVGKEGRP